MIGGSRPAHGAGLFLSSSLDGSNAGHQLPRIERLGQAVTAPADPTMRSTSPRPPTGSGPACFFLPNAFEQLEAVLIGQHDIQDRQRNLPDSIPGACRPFRDTRVSTRTPVPSGIRQAQRAELGVVVDDQQPLCGRFEIGIRMKKCPVRTVSEHLRSRKSIMMESPPPFSR